MIGGITNSESMAAAVTNGVARANGRDRDVTAAEPPLFGVLSDNGLSAIVYALPS
jgi:hypothetical protein